MVRLKQDESLDDLLINDLKIIQKTKGFRFTLDAVLLAHFATVKDRDKIIDLGTGTGVIPLILSTRAERLQIHGIEIQEDMAEMANRSVVLNGLGDTITILNEDIKNLHYEMGGGIYTLVTANPPYWKLNEGKPSKLPTRASARHELNCVLEDVVAAASKLLNYQGRFALIHRTERLCDIFSLLRQYNLEPRRLRFIHPFAGESAQHVLIEARKKAAVDLKVLPPLIVYEHHGKYSQEVLNWYGKGGN